MTLDWYNRANCCHHLYLLQSSATTATRCKDDAITDPDVQGDRCHPADNWRSQTSKEIDPSMHIQEYAICIIIQPTMNPQHERICNCILSYTASPNNVRINPWLHANNGSIHSSSEHVIINLQFCCVLPPSYQRCTPTSPPFIINLSAPTCKSSKQEKTVIVLPWSVRDPPPAHFTDVARPKPNFLVGTTKHRWVAKLGTLVGPLHLCLSLFFLEERISVSFLAPRSTGSF